MNDGGAAVKPIGPAVKRGDAAVKRGAATGAVDTPRSDPAVDRKAAQGRMVTAAGPAAARAPRCDPGRAAAPSPYRTCSALTPPGTGSHPPRAGPNVATLDTMASRVTWVVAPACTQGRLARGAPA